MFLFQARRWRTTTFSGATRSNRFVATLCVEGAFNDELFVSWPEQHLANKRCLGYLIVMDNLLSLKTRRVRHTAVAAADSLTGVSQAPPRIDLRTMAKKR